MTTRFECDVAGCTFRKFTSLAQGKHFGMWPTRLPMITFAYNYTIFNQHGANIWIWRGCVTTKRSQI
jgi:hypothetical protein